MTEAEIQEKVIAIVAEQMGVDKAEIKRETSFTNDLNADSLDIVELSWSLRTNSEHQFQTIKATRFRPLDLPSTTSRRTSALAQRAMLRSPQTDSVG